MNPRIMAPGQQVQRRCDRCREVARTGTLTAWNACLSDFVVMCKGALAVSGPRVLELATGGQVSPEDLGGRKVHAEEECLALVRRLANGPTKL